MKMFMMVLTACVAFCAAQLPQTAKAHGPSRLKTEQSVTLNASPDEVWAVLGQFGAAEWLPDTTAISAVSGEAKGATRQRSFANGEVVEEELLKKDDAKRAISIRFTADNLAAVAATNYALHVVIKDEGGQAKVELRGAFYRAFPQNDPPAAENDDAAIASITALHDSYIAALVERFGPAQ